MVDDMAGRTLNGIIRFKSLHGKPPQNPPFQKGSTRMREPEKRISSRLVCSIISCIGSVILSTPSEPNVRTGFVKERWKFEYKPGMEWDATFHKKSHHFTA